MPDMKALMPVLARGGGRGRGAYTHVDAAGALLDRHEVSCHSEFPADGSADYRLSTRNRWADGRETRASYRADYRDGRLYWRDGPTGWMCEIDDMTINLRFGFERDPAITVCEMIQISRDGLSRARTWHWFRDDRLFKITLTTEEREA